MPGGDPEPISSRPPAELSYWLLLSRLSLPPPLVCDLLQCFGDAAGVFAASREELRAVDRSAERLYRRVREAEQTTDLAEFTRQLQSMGARVVIRDDAEYPALLRRIHTPPPVLFVGGQLSALGGPCVAMVGSRAASAAGLRVATTLARGLAEAGLTVVSGMAVGIDGAAHRGALDGGGPTVAVLGCSLEIPYPRANVDLRARIRECGALVSEFPPRTEPRRWAFPQRNRLVSGMCMGTIVVEAPERSGALITADLALEQHREVMAVPGETESGRNRGCHNLIRDGAVLVETAEDVVNALGLEPRRPSAPRPAPPPCELTPPERLALGALTREGALIEHVTAATGFPPAEVVSALMLLEMKGLAQRLPGGRYGLR